MADPETGLPIYPHIEPERSGFLDVGDGHRVYYEEAGNSNGEPVLVVHGGPGGGCNADMRRYHDPSRYRLILFDQRGCGRSTPHASIENNTTWHLVSDMEQLRESLDIGEWHLFGGSWGSTLSLAYAETHPDRVTSLVLRGIFLLRRSELDWFYQEGCSWLFPEEFRTFQNHIPKAERGDMIAAYHKRLVSQDHETLLPAAKAWSAWEGHTLSLKPNPKRVRAFEEESYAIAFARIESHYFHNAGFFETDGWLLKNAGRLADIPGTIVHGRYDVITPVKNAIDLHEVWPKSRLRIIPDAGHALSEPGISSALVEATRAAAIA